MREACGWGNKSDVSVEKEQGEQIILLALLLYY